MNKVILVGRLTRDPEVKQTQSQIPVCSFSVAVDRRFKSASGERQTDFIDCVAWRQQAELLGRYFQKGSRIGLVGTLQTRSYEDRQGQRRYVTEVIIDEIEFIDTKKESQAQQGKVASEPSDHAKEKPSHAPAVPETDTDFYPTMDDDTTLPFDL